MGGAELAFCFGVHDHQPVGNFDHVVAEAASRGYLPFLERVAARPALRLTVHVSGGLLEWLRERAPRVFDLLYVLTQKLETKKPIEVISGYRSPATNAMLAAYSEQVAKSSLHTVGMAVDIRIPGRELKDVYKTALALKAGGVGYYPVSKFVHVDVGRVRTWWGS